MKFDKDCITIGVVCIFGIYVVKKLNDVHDEIIHFEECKGVYCNKKESDKMRKMTKKEA